MSNPRFGQVVEYYFRGHQNKPEQPRLAFVQAVAQRDGDEVTHLSVLKFGTVPLDVNCHPVSRTVRLRECAWPGNAEDNEWICTVQDGEADRAAQAKEAARKKAEAEAEREAKKKAREAEKAKQAASPVGA